MKYEDVYIHLQPHVHVVCIRVLCAQSFQSLQPIYRKCTMTFICVHTLRGGKGREGEGRKETGGVQIEMFVLCIQTCGLMPEAPAFPSNDLCNVF